MVKRRQHLVRSAVQLLQVKVHEINRRALTHHIEPTQIRRVFFQKLVGFQNVTQAFAHLSTFCVLCQALEQESTVRAFGLSSKYDVFQKKRVSPPASLIYAFCKEICGHEFLE